VGSSETTRYWGINVRVRSGWGYAALILLCCALPATAAPAPRKDSVPPPFFPVRLLWEAPLGAPATPPVVVAAGRVFVALRTGTVAALAVDTGETLWTARLEPRGPMIADGERLLVPIEGAIEAVDPTTGSALWRAPVGNDPVLALMSTSGWVFALLESGTLEARRADTGARVWQQALGVPARAAPVVLADSIFVATRDGTIVALGVTDGVPRWRTRADGEAAGLVARDDRLYFGTGAKFFYCLTADDGRIEWRWRIGAGIVGAPALDDRHVYLVALDNQIRALDRRSGAQRWRKPLIARPIGAPVRVDGGIVPAVLASELRGLEPRDGGNQGRYPTDREVGVPVGVDRPYAQGGDLVIVPLSDGTTLALQARIEPAILPLTVLPGSAVPLTPAAAPAGLPPTAPR
jgi:outer membrane protein assembly factor BamB